ncbi:hypothetical protein AAHC03_09946 [Spirometra sp. Aus1]
MGTRTKAQANPVAQLVAQFTRLGIGCELGAKMPNCSQPKVMILEDDNLLENIKFTDDAAPRPITLSVPEQSYVLNWCEIHKRSHPNDELTKEQCLTLVNSVIVAANSAGSSWPVLTEALFKRAPLEQRSFARLERALRQLEELTAQFDRATPPVEDRGLQHFFWTRMPSIWTIEMEYARVLASFGSLKAALDVYLRWEMWDDAITAYTLLGQADLAEKCIRERIASGDETPDLYCSLGDVTKDPAHYEKAWELSNHKSARAMKSLGLRSLGVDKDPAKAAEYLEKSLLINRFQINLWFTLGCCQLQLKNFSKAETAFRTCVALEPDNFEAWNNLASAVIFGGRKPAALELLKEATKWNYESWRVWENILLVSIDVAAFGDTIRAFHRLIDLRQKHVDPQVLGILVRAVCEDTPDKEGRGASRYRSKLLELMGRATSTAPSDADTWRLYATLLLDDYDQSKPSVFQRAVQCLQKSYHCRLKNVQSGWELVTKTRSALITDLRALNKLLLAEKEAICGEKVAEKEKGVTSAGDETVATDAEATSPNLTQIAFLHSSLSSLRLSINSLVSRLKKAGDCCMDPTVSSDLSRDVETLREMLSAVTNVLNDLPPGSEVLVKLLGRCRALARPGILRHFHHGVHSPACDVDCLSDSNFVSSMRRNIKERSSTVDIDEMLLLYDRYRGGDRSLLPRLRELCLSLPNFSHPNTPVGDPSKTRLLRLNGSPKPTDFPPKDAVDLLSNEILPNPRARRRLRGLGLLRCHNMVPGCGYRSYNFYGSLALLETALVSFVLDRVTGAGMQQISVPDILPASAIESCGFPTSGARTQIFTIDDGAEGCRRFCLSGTAEMSIASYCAGRSLGSKSPAEYFCAVSRCYRREVPNQESLLYRTHQFTKVEMFCVSEPTMKASEEAFDKILTLQESMFADLGLHYRVLEMPTSELGNPAFRKVDIEAFMPGDGSFGEISSTSNCTDYQARRLNIRWRSPDDFAFTLNGTACAVTRVIKALVETHQRKDGTVGLPQVLWPYMNNATELKPDESPVVFS